MTFLALGDFGRRGIGSGADGRGSSRSPARCSGWPTRSTSASWSASATRSTTGRAAAGPTGAFDEDWWLPSSSRTVPVFAHLAFYPTAGNHDSSDTEASDDRSSWRTTSYLRPGSGRGKRSGGVDRSGPVLPAAGRRAAGAGLRRHHLGGRAGPALVRRAGAAGLVGAHAGEQRRGVAAAVLAPPRILRRAPPRVHDRAAGAAGAALPAQRRPAAAARPEHNFQHGQSTSCSTWCPRRRQAGRAGADPLRGSRTLSWGRRATAARAGEAGPAVVVPYGPTPAGAQPRPIPRRSPERDVTDESIVIRWAELGVRLERESRGDRQLVLPPSARPAANYPPSLHVAGEGARVRGARRRTIPATGR